MCQQPDLLCSLKACLTWNVLNALCLFICLLVLLICVKFRNFQSCSPGFPRGRHWGLFTFNVLCRMKKARGCTSWSSRNKCQANQFVLNLFDETMTFLACWRVQRSIEDHHNTRLFHENSFCWLIHAYMHTCRRGWHSSPPKLHAESPTF